MLRQEKSVHFNVRYEGGVKQFWTEKEYHYQDLILNGFVIHREIPGQTKTDIPKARIDIFYDSPDGIGTKKINGIDHKVYKEASKFLTSGELEELNRKWTRAKYAGQYNHSDPLSRGNIYDVDTPRWQITSSLKDIILNSKQKKEIDTILAKGDKTKLFEIDMLINKYKGATYLEKAMKNSLAEHISGLDLSATFEEARMEKNVRSRLEKDRQDQRDAYIKQNKKLEKKVQDYITNKHYAPLQDLFLTKDLKKEEVAEKNELSTLYKYLKGSRELPRSKAIQYADKLGVAPGSLMFDPKMIAVWGNVNANSKVQDPNHVAYVEQEDFENPEPNFFNPGEIYIPIETQTVVCPTELYRVDVKAVMVNDKDGTYNKFVAYYYETNQLDPSLNNKLCMVREKTGNSLLRGAYNYYLGIYQIYGNKKRILNFDPTSEIKILKDDVNPDLVAPIISFTKPTHLEISKVIDTDVIKSQELGRLIRAEETAKWLINSEKNKYEKLQKEHDRLLRENPSQKDIKETKDNLAKAMEALKKSVKLEVEAQQKMAFIMSKYLDSAAKRRVEKESLIPNLFQSTEFMKKLYEKKIA